MFATIICLILLTSIFCLIFLQNFSSIFLRTFGLICIYSSIILYYFKAGFDSLSPVVIIIMSILATLGILSDIYSATLRTWFFRISYDSMRITLYGMFLGTIIGSLLLSLMTNGNIINVVHGMVLGAIIGSIIGELKNTRKTSFKSMGKTVLGTLTGVFGMTIKMIVGIQMIEIFIYLSSFPIKVI